MRIIEDLSIIEDGKYIALWCGYSIEIAFNNGKISPNLITDDGIRGFAEVIVEIKDGVGTILNATNQEITELRDSYRVAPNFFKRYK